MTTIYADATEYRYLPLVVEPIDGEYPALAVGDVQVAIAGPGQDGTPVPADLLVAGDPGRWWVGVLIGPGVGGVTLAPGRYRLRAVVADTPEDVRPWPAQDLVVATPPEGS